MTSVTLSELAKRIGGTLTGGGEGIAVNGVAALGDATSSQISFVTDEKHLAEAKASQAAALLVAEGMAVGGKPTIALAPLWEGIVAALDLLHPPPSFEPGVHPSATVDPTAQLGEGVSIQANAVVEAGAVIGPRTVIEAGVFVGTGAHLGADCHLFPAAVVMHECRVGDRVIIHPGAIVGADGFRYEQTAKGHLKIPQVGIVVVEDDVEIGANACIDRASLAETRIGRGTKIDNLVQIGHNDQVGEHCILVSQAGLSGSVKIGDRTVIAGQVGIADHIEIGSDTVIGAQSGVSKSRGDKQFLFGTPALPQREYARREVAARRVPRLIAEVQRLREQIEALGGKPDQG